jgi:adenosylmethionine-8-amino-7-oxononanoate aminotransferase
VVTRYDPADVASVWHCWTQMEMYLKLNVNVIEQAAGVEMTDQDGKVFLDANSSLWNVNIGHGNPQVIQAITDQLHKLDHSSLLVSTNGPSIRLAKRLIALTGERYQHVFFTNSGSEATDTALKIARQYFYNQGQPERYKVISLVDAYHGSTLGAISACGIPYDRQAFGPLLPGFFQVPAPNPFECPEGITEEAWVDLCIAELESVIGREGPQTIAAFIAEPVQGSEGICVIPDAYWRHVRRICDQYGILWISDEVATGFGRTGRWFAAEHSGCWPDMMTMAKGITSGYIPLGAVMVTRAIFAAFLGSIASEREFVHGFTTSGHPVACAAAMANIAVIEEQGLIANAAEVGAYLLKRLAELRRFPFVVDVQGKGLMLGIRLSGWTGKTKWTAEYPPATLVSTFLAREGILVHAGGKNAVVLAPALTFTRERCDQVMQVFDKVLSSLSRAW